MTRSTRTVKTVKPRVWRACEICRKRKDPCGFCKTNKKSCTFSQTQDHAAINRQREADTQTRLGNLEDRLDKLIPLIETTHTWMAQMSQSMSGGSSSANPLQQAPVLPSSTSAAAAVPNAPDTVQPRPTLPPAPAEEDPPMDHDLDGMGADEQRLRDTGSDLDPAGGPEEGRREQGRHRSQTWAERLAGHFAQDSSGNMRYLGGAPTFVLAEAVDSVRQAHLSPETIDDHPATTTSVDHIYFRPNVLYRPLNGLPAPETIEHPPAALSDTLVSLYFSKIHHTFPIVDKSQFLRNYETTLSGLRQGQPSKDARFLCVLFAVYASAASLAKQAFQDQAEFQFSSPSEYIGLEFYEKALYMYWISFRMMTVDSVTCMALLSSWLAGRNTLSQAWLLTGQAVRGAQDLGLHRSLLNADMPRAVKEHRRRVWWCVYGLDKMLSVSLGRPSGINDDDCDVELPTDDYCCEDVESLTELEPPGDNPMTGLKSLMEIYTIAGEIERRAHNIKFLRQYDNVADHPKVRDTIDKLDEMLEGWSDTLPDSIRYAANNPERPSMFALCLLGYFTMYACTLNLHRPFMPDFNTSSPAHTFNSLQKCMSAAQGCIRVGEEVKKLLPTSHHCQLCVQYLTISGVTLLRCLPYVSDSRQLITDATRCRRLLAKLEDTWPGSKQCGALLQDLLDVCKNNRPMSTPAPRGSKSAHPTPSVRVSAERGKRRRMNDGQTQEVPSASQGSQPESSSAHQHQSLNVPQMPIEDQLSAWTDVEGQPFDYSHLSNQAPFDLTGDLEALLEQIQNPSSNYDIPALADVWPIWQSGGESTGGV
ncbi:hypothetical protein IAT38_000589 [Cryptococcus sp. DSM 104549]